MTVPVRRYLIIETGPWSLPTTRHQQLYNLMKDHCGKWNITLKKTIFPLIAIYLNPDLSFPFFLLSNNFFFFKSFWYLVDSTKLLDSSSEHLDSYLLTSFNFNPNMDG